MLPYIHIILPTYGVLCALGIIAAIIVLLPRIKKYEIRVIHTVQLCIFMIIGMIIGSKILFVLTQIDTLVKDFSLSLLAERFINSGFVFYGGLFGALFGIYVYSSVRKFPKQPIYNMVTPCILIFHAFGRIGCFLSGCCYGIECPFGFEMAAGSGVIRFPVQLAESLGDILILAVVLLAERKKGKQIDLLRIYMVAYAVCRFLLEFLRGDEVRGRFLCFSTSQWISLGVIVYYAVKFVIHRIKGVKEVSTP